MSTRLKFALIDARRIIEVDSNLLRSILGSTFEKRFGDFWIKMYRSIVFQRYKHLLSRDNYGINDSGLLTNENEERGNEGRGKEGDVTRVEYFSSVYEAKLGGEEKRKKTIFPIR